MLDVAIVGGSFAGLTAAQLLGRASRNVRVIDAGAPRNRFSPAAHGIGGWDGTPPAEILARFRADLARYPTVDSVEGEVVAVTGTINDFRLAQKDGAEITARRIILAHGVRDMLPDIPGLSEGWGTRVLHCPYCHGYEVKGEPIAVLAVHPMSGHQARLLRGDWSADVTLITAGVAPADAEDLARDGVRVDDRTVAQAQADAAGITLTFSDGSHARFGAVFLGSKASLAGSPAEQIGCALSDGPQGPYVAVGPMAQTSTPGVFAAGDLARPAPNINFALADGAQAATGCHASLLFPDLVQPLETLR